MIELILLFFKVILIGLLFTWIFGGILWAAWSYHMSQLYEQEMKDRKG